MSDLFRLAASAYWDRGLSVVPVEHGSKRPAKEIVGWQGYCNGPASPTIQSAWMTRYAVNGIGLLLSTPISDGARIGAVDVDDDRCVRLAHAILGRCQSRKRGRKGETIFVAVRNDQRIKSTVLYDYQKAQKVDVLFNGKMTVLPPSRHPETGEPYIWLGTPLLDCDFADLPILTPGKLDLLRFVLRAEQTAALIMAEGTHDAGMIMVWRLVERGHDDGLIAEIITALLPVDYSGNSIDELPGWIESARRKIRVSQEQLPLDEEIARSVHDFLSPLVFVPGEGFRRYQDGSWPLVNDFELNLQIKSAVTPRLKPRQQVSSYLNGVRRCLELNAARNDFGVASRELIGLRNGVFDAHRGSFQPHRPENELRYRLDFDYDPGATCPVYERQLHDTFAGDAKTMALFDEFAGLTLVPDMRFQKAMYLIGEAGSGKSTLLRVLESMHDPEAVAVTPLDRLDGERYLTNLVHKLVCISFDVQTSSKVFGEAFVRITGGDPIAVRKPYQEVEGRVVPSVRFAGSMNLNIPPSIGAADALRRRLIFLMCGERIATPDRNRDSALLAERPGIFIRWMIALDRLMRRAEFDIPESSVAEVREYTTTQDAVSIFLAERLVIDPNAATLIPNIVRAYNEWADELQERRRAGPFLSRKLCALGVRKTWLRSERALCVRLKPLNRSERDDLPDY